MKTVKEAADKKADVQTASQAQEPGDQVVTQPHWIVTAAFAAVLGAIPWAVFGFLLNVVIPVIGVVICCQTLGANYYWLAYWFPLAAGVLVAGFVFWGLALKPRSNVK